MNSQLKTAKKRRKYYTMKKKKEDRTKLYDRIRFLKTFNKVDEKGNVLIPSRYYLPFVKAINCYSCKYCIKNTMPKDCEHYDPIYLRLEDVEKDNSKKSTLFGNSDGFVKVTSSGNAWFVENTDPLKRP